MMNKKDSTPIFWNAILSNYKSYNIAEHAKMSVYIDCFLKSFP